MLKKIATVATGLVLFASPILATAQVYSLPSLPANPSIEQLQALIVQLTEILQQLLASRNSNTASLQILSPNGGEAIPTGAAYNISWKQQSLTNPIAIA